MDKLVKVSLRFELLDSSQVNGLSKSLRSFGRIDGPFNTENYTNFFVYVDSENIDSIDTIKDSIRLVSIIICGNAPIILTA